MNALAVSTTAMILTAGCVVQLDRFHPKTWWRDVAESGATIVHYLGVMPAVLLNLPETSFDKAHCVRFGYGANANPADHAAFEERFGFPLIEAWAMTETGGGALIAASREPRHVGTRCIGRPPPALEILIEKESGELLVRQAGPDPRRGFFSGYFKAPGYVAVLDSLPVTSTSKVQKAKLADFALDPTDCFDVRERKRRP